AVFVFEVDAGRPGSIRKENRGRLLRDGENTETQRHRDTKARNKKALAVRLCVSVSLCLCVFHPVRSSRGANRMLRAAPGRCSAGRRPNTGGWFPYRRDIGIPGRGSRGPGSCPICFESPTAGM